MSDGRMTLGIVGCGNMGAALAIFIPRHLPLCDVIVHDVDRARQEGLARNSGVRGASSLQELIKDAGVVLLAVKPQDIDPVLAQLRGRTDRLLISIAAGVTLAYLEGSLAGAPVIRAMPNLNAMIGRSATALCAGAAVSEEQRQAAKRIFQAVGVVVFVAEGLMNAVTAVAGSGPAFVATMKDVLPPEELNQILIKTAGELGMERGVAERLARATVSGTLEMLAVNFDAPTLIRRVASKGGTTEAGLAVLEREGKTPQALAEAVFAACRRADELSRKN
ncbi:MAG: pyrroline-5-carboxylate reductase [Deltaproteobacteria bacterium]